MSKIVTFFCLLFLITLSFGESDRLEAQGCRMRAPNPRPMNWYYLDPYEYYYPQVSCHGGYRLGYRNGAFMYVP